jgi:hypothetical protein
MRGLVIALLVACGPSAAEVKAAKTASYRSDPHQLLKLAEEAAQHDYRIGDVDETAYAFITLPKFYDSDGYASSLDSLKNLPKRDADGRLRPQPGSFSVAFVVRVIVRDEQHVLVTVTPKAFRGADDGKPQEVMPDDPNLPAFISDRADALTFAIYNRARSYAGN